MEAVRKALFNDFANWKIVNKDHLPPLEDQDLLNVYMEEKYAMRVGEGNVFDTIKEMNSPPSSENGKQGNMIDLASKIAKCAKRNEPSQAGRRRRAASASASAGAGEKEKNICCLMFMPQCLNFGTPLRPITFY